MIPVHHVLSKYYFFDFSWIRVDELGTCLYLDNNKVILLVLIPKSST